MAMVKCEECGKDVSTEATACPGCGARRTRRSSSWFFLLILGVGVYAAYQGLQPGGALAEWAEENRGP